MQIDLETEKRNWQLHNDFGVQFDVTTLVNGNVQRNVPRGTVQSKETLEKFAQVGFTYPPELGTAFLSTQPNPALTFEFLPLTDTDVAKHCSIHFAMNRCSW